MHTVHWGDEIAAFHEATASTHVLNEDAHRLLDVLVRNVDAMSSASLWSTAFACAPSELDCQSLDELLGTLLQAGLVTATSS